MIRISRKEFAALKKLWYAKLKDSGFYDLETFNNKYIRKMWNGSLVSTRMRRDAKQDYYLLAGRWTHTYENFRSDAEKEIWSLYADGLSTHQIAKKLQIPLMRSKLVIRYYNKIFLAEMKQKSIVTEDNSEDSEDQE